MSDPGPQATSSDRLPLPAEESLTPEQRDAVRRISDGPRGEIVGPFIPLLRSPELMTRLQLVGEYLRFGSVLDDDLTELVILMVARAWDQQFEWGYHHPLAVKQGLPEEVIESVASGELPAAGRIEVRLVAQLVHELLGTKQVSEPTYRAVEEALGPQRLIEVVGTAGYYTTLAMAMNTALTPPPPDAPRLP